MQYFYDADAELGKSIDLPEEEARHLLRVLRHQIGDSIHLLNGKGKCFQARIVSGDKNHCRLMVETILREEASAPAHCVAVSPVKNSSRMEWFLEKSVELGLSHIVPLICDRTEKFSFKSDRFHKILISALKQSGNLHLPKLEEALPFSEFIQQPFNGLKMIADCQEKNEHLAARNLDLPGLVLIGPEGDFTISEMEEAHKNGFESISLGNLRLRTETAALCAACILTQSAYR